MPTRNIDDIVIPSEILAVIAQEDKELGVDELERIGLALGTKKSEAMTHRQSSGIEDTWALCEDAYAGIDDMNRGEYIGNRWSKPASINAPVTTGSLKNQDVRSTAFVRLTTRYVDAGAAKIGEILLPIDDKAFSFKPTPVPTLIKGKEDLTPIPHTTGEPLQRPATPEEQAATGQTPQPGQAPPLVDLRTADVVDEQFERAMKKAKLAENQIFDWMTECQHPFEMRKVIFDSARLGVGVLKGPFPDRRRRMAMIKDANGVPQITVQETIVPIDKWVSAWNVFPDPACGEDIRNGDYLFERAYFTEKQVLALKGLPGYIDAQIDKALLVGPVQAKEQTRNPTDIENDVKRPYVVWFYHGTMEKTDFQLVNAKAADGLEKDATRVHVVATMINDIVIHGTVAPLEKSGDLPYHAVPWIRRPGHWAGTGVAEQLFAPQRIVNASTRAMLNNAGISAGPQIVINQRGIVPANGEWAILPNKIWYLTEAGQTDDIRKAFLSIDIHNVGDQLYKIVEYGMRLAEESSSIPLITQGLSGKTTPDTLGATQLQDNNANQLLRYIGYSFDGYVTVRLVNQYYEYLLLDPTVDNDLKGDFLIHAQGSVALVERAIQDQTIAQMTPLAENPAFGVNPKKWFAMLAKSKHLNPADFQYTKEEQEKIDSLPKPQAPAIEVAKIKAQTVQMQIQADQQRAQEEDALARELADLDAKIREHATELQNTTAQLRVKLDTDRDTVYSQAEAERARAEFEHNMEKLRIEKDLAMMDYGSKNQLSLNQVKAKLADTTLKLNAQKELALMDAKLRVHEHTSPSGDALLKPATQVPGKAPAGHAAAQI